MADRWAACDRHLADALRKMPEDKARHMRVTHVATANEVYTCECGVPAHWFVLATEVASRPDTAPKVYCDALAVRGTGTGMCARLLDEHGVCPNAGRHHPSGA